MIIHGLEESSFYQFILDEGRREERNKMLKVIAELLRRMISKRFPDIHLGEELEAVGDPDILQYLICELDDIHDPDALHQRIAELATMARSSLHS